eukprot:12322247-Alexandrium_andersonii.AAC.1
MGIPWSGHVREIAWDCGLGIPWSGHVREIAWDCGGRGAGDFGGGLTCTCVCRDKAFASHALRGSGARKRWVQRR